MLGRRKKKGLGARIKELFLKDSLTETFFEELEELLLTSDVGASATMEIAQQLRERVETERPADFEAFSLLLREILSKEISVGQLEPETGKVNVFLVLGVNGVGKTTSIAKLANHFYHRNPDRGIVLAAADTFRAAAIDQLKLHGERLDIPVVAHQPGSDPGAVVFDAMQSAVARNHEVVIADTAGRMHNKSHLVKELQKIARIIEKQSQDAVVKKILVLDATTGQNAISQAEIFHEAVGIDGVIMTKYDSMSRGGMAVTVSRRLGLPFCYVGFGEKVEDLKPFDKDEFIERILSQ